MTTPRRAKEKPRAATTVSTIATITLRDDAGRRRVRKHTRRELDTENERVKIQQQVLRSSSIPTVTTLEGVAPAVPTIRRQMRQVDPTNGERK